MNGEDQDIGGESDTNQTYVLQTCTGCTMTENVQELQEFLLQEACIN